MNTKLNKSDYLLLAFYFLISFLMQSYNYVMREALLREYFIDFPMQIIGTLFLIFVFIFWLIPEYFVKKKKYVHFVIFGLLAMAFFGIIYKYVGYWSGDNDWSKFPSSFRLILTGISISSEIMGLPFALLLTKKFYESQNKVLEVEKKQKENELKLLRSQLNPHFLFNNLNTLDALIDSNPIKAKEYINRLSLIYRYLIQTKDSEVMELTEEINLAENYIFLIKTRFGDDYDFVIKQNKMIFDKFIPTGALQTLLENVVKHNKATHNIQIKTIIEIDDDWLSITNTKTNSDSESLGTGLENLKTRYQLLSHKNIKINETTSVYKITIPIIKLSTES